MTLIWSGNVKNSNTSYLSLHQRTKFSCIRNAHHVFSVYPTCFCPACNIAFHTVGGKSTCLAFIKDFVTSHPSFHFAGGFCVDTQGETGGLRDQTTLSCCHPCSRVGQFCQGYSGPRDVKEHPTPATIFVTSSPQVRRRPCLFMVADQHPG